MRHESPISWSAALFLPSSHPLTARLLIKWSYCRDHQKTGIPGKFVRVQLIRQQRSVPAQFCPKYTCSDNITQSVTQLRPRWISFHWIYHIPALYMHPARFGWEQLEQTRWPPMSKSLGNSEKEKLPIHSGGKTRSEPEITNDYLLNAVVYCINT